MPPGETATANANFSLSPPNSPPELQQQVSPRLELTLSAPRLVLTPISVSSHAVLSPHSLSLSLLHSLLHCLRSAFERKIGLATVSIAP
jgi:hypothetical protein